MKPLTKATKTALKQIADPVRAVQQQTYMKSVMPYHGVAAPEVDKLCKTLFEEYPVFDQAAWHEAILDLWRNADHREERYVAENLAGTKRYRQFQTPATVSVYREMIVTGAWWDLVDGLINRFSELLTDHPVTTERKMRTWATVKNIWQRRIAILCQLNMKQATDTHLLEFVILQNAGDKAFFICKAIGWALRSYSVTDPDWVVAFVRAHEETLSSLSRREALKRLAKNRPLA